jgi:hypothetical protein
METKSNIAKAIIAVMKAVKGIDKTMTIGTGNNSYKGVPDQEVKKVIGDAMAANGLCMLPIDTEAKSQIDRWEEVDQYSKSTPKDMKTKQSVFTEVKTKYLLLHESGESIELSGYGHGIDTQDKGAGKATTYALKYTLLYTFLVPTGKIDDADVHHSDSIETPNKAAELAEKRQRDINAQVSKLRNCNSVDELKTLKSITPEWIVLTREFKTAATARFKELTVSDLETA